jgi:glucokinase
MSEIGLRLVGDIGGTNARFGIAVLGDGVPVIEHVRHLRVADYGTAQAGVAHYLAELPAERRPRDAVLAVAGPVVHGVADLTNAQGWHLNAGVLASELGLARIRLINDFAALSLAVPLLRADGLRMIGCDRLIDANQTVSLVGPGTGTGVGARVVDHGVPAILVTEGGHVGFAPVDDLEIELLRVLRSHFGRVSVERILAGQGLVNLHQALAQIEGRAIPETTPSGITQAALTGDAAAVTTLNRFFAILGSVAGDMALAHGAWGGVLLAGGILPRVVDLFEKSQFRERFEDKGRLSKVVRDIPTNLIVAGDVALLGAAGGM